jgi:ferric-dicitrate binding protein FerR (iron transport regulator)
MSQACGMSILDVDLEADLEIAVDYLTGSLPPERMVGVEDRIKHDACFRRNVVPLVELWTLPRRFRGELSQLLHPSQHRHSTVARQQEWDRFLALAGMKPVPLSILLGEPVPRRRRWKRAVTSLALVIAIPSVPLVYWGNWAKARVDMVNSIVAVTKAGAGSAPPAAATSQPTVYETGPGEQRTVSLPTATITLRPSSRLTVTTESTVMSAIDGEAEVVVEQKRPFALIAASVPFMFNRGRYRVSHPLGSATTISVDSGTVFVPLGTPSTSMESDGKLHIKFAHVYSTGARITAKPGEKLTTVTAVAAHGQALEPFTVDNTTLQLGK